MRKNMKGGFTLVELSLSIVFISILSIIIVLLINNAIASYRRGLTLNEINTVGMDLVDDIRTVVQSSKSVNICDKFNSVVNEGNCEGDGGKKFVSITVVRDIKLDGISEKVPIYGAFCTGLYSYIWNSGYFFNGKIKDSKISPAVLTWKSGSGDKSYSPPDGGDVKLIKVRDSDRDVCKNAVTDDYKINDGVENHGKFSIGEFDKDEDVPEVIELLASGNNINLAVYDFSASAPAVSASGKVSFYSMSFILGTVQGGINVMASGNFCQAPAGGGEDENFNYCAINKFNFAAQAIGGE